MTHDIIVMDRCLYTESDDVKTGPSGELSFLVVSMLLLEVEGIIIIIISGLVFLFASLCPR
jgi:hypothetical protein